MTISWQFKIFSALDTAEIYEILALRQKVFILEQKDIYLDADGKDIEAVHLSGADQNKLIAYARIILPFNSDKEKSVSFGRVIVDYRGRGLAQTLIQKIFNYLHESIYAAYPVKISAQVYLKNFYESLGFEAISGIYLDGTIPHIDMIRK
jgi:ElaA protein